MVDILDEQKRYELLSLSIIKRAIIDYECGVNLINCSNCIEGQKLVNDVRRFFYSDWFVALSTVDGPTMFKQIEKNFKKYGTCMPFKDKDEDIFI